jgi:hypothetical protein
VGPGHRADAAAGRVADDADVGGGAVDPGEAVGRGLLHHPGPLHPGTDAYPGLVRVQGDLVETAGHHEQVAGERPLGTVAGRLHTGGEAVGSGEPDRLGHVLGGADGDDGGRPHGDGEVPRGDERVVLRLVRGVDRAGQPRAQAVEGDGGVDDGGVEGERHGMSSRSDRTMEEPCADVLDGRLRSP